MEKYAAASPLKVDWDDALCDASRIEKQGISADLWHSPWDSKPSAEAAKTCFECPIRLQCLAYACAAKEEGGIWGGLPARIRTGFTREYSAHDYETLKELDNPYTADNGSYASFNLIAWNPATDAEEDQPAVPEGKEVPGYENYIATPDGFVYNTKTQKRAMSRLEWGHLRTNIRHPDIKGYVSIRIDHLVAAAYMGFTLGSDNEVWHENEDPLDNRVENLGWSEIEFPQVTGRLAGNTNTNQEAA
ncbi:WhiB family transcriptional regulator [Streptomyces tauricus]|uniref:WhiB family transcriptional regulator n=2 Tax=Streptomyces tauricus TaxID=68274 RepID=A0ABZ1JXX3_9ACTN